MAMMMMKNKDTRGKASEQRNENEENFAAAAFGEKQR